VRDVLALSADARTTQTTAQAAWKPLLDRSRALHINHNTLAVDFVAVHALVRRQHVTLMLKFGEGIAGRLALAVVDHFEILERAI